MDCIASASNTHPSCWCRAPLARLQISPLLLLFLRDLSFNKHCKPPLTLPGDLGVSLGWQPQCSRSCVYRAGLAKALAFIRPGDCLVVWKLDRLGRSLPHLLATVTGLKKRGIAFRSLTEQLDTTTPQGEFLFHIFGALAQFERSLIQERVQAGLAAARRRGRRGGRPPAIDAEKLAAVIAALDSGATKAAVCRTFGIKRSTLLDSLVRIGWAPALQGAGGVSGATTAIDRSPDL